jgi:hypothetical protein
VAEGQALHTPDPSCSRRRGPWASQGLAVEPHLAARDGASGAFVMLGKTFKGMTDEMLAWQTREMPSAKRTRDDWTVGCVPEIVVEVAFNDLQASPRYPPVGLRCASRASNVTGRTRRRPTPTRSRRCASFTPVNRARRRVEVQPATTCVLEPEPSAGCCTVVVHG